MLKARYMGFGTSFPTPIGPDMLSVTNAAKEFFERHPTEQSCKIFKVTFHGPDEEIHIDPSFVPLERNCE